mmetsp:Transcript_38388/g.79812  ORF Transcript_38388/g.79812 Transcript_38388/m.79812 type:complete len:119 (-) Transcript_38388:341-697(-)
MIWIGTTEKRRAKICIIVRSVKEASQTSNNSGAQRLRASRVILWDSGSNERGQKPNKILCIECVATRCPVTAHCDSLNHSSFAVSFDQILLPLEILPLGIQENQKRPTSHRLLLLHGC